jgi:hydroxymethylglutaryl-CoA reductase (NADPH)
MATRAVTGERIRIPRDKSNDYTHESATKRREFVRDRTGASLSHVGKYSAVF